MTRAERETVMIANLADMDEGFVRFETTEKAAFKRLKRMAGTALKVTESKNQKGEVIAWICEAPAHLWGGLGFKGKRTMTPEARAAAAERGRAALATTRMAKKGKISA